MAFFSKLGHQVSTFFVALFYFFAGFSRIDFLVAFRNLLQHTRRTLFLGGAIVAVTALMVVAERKRVPALIGDATSVPPLVT